MGKTRAEYQKTATPCCGRKPLIYMQERHQFCTRCCRAYDLETEQQVNNWAWRHLDGEWRMQGGNENYQPDHDKWPVRKK